MSRRTNPRISLTNLTKNYGKSRGIRDVSFEVFPGEVFGFLGPNGAGKTTTIRTLMGLIKATSGSASILGMNALESSPELRKRIGYLPGVFATYSNYTALQFLRFVARMRNVECDDLIFNYAERLRLDLHRHIHDLSKGNRQKVGVIYAFMHKPDVLFLDEPTSGLDPLVQREFERILNEAQARGASIILSSHVLSEVENLADRIAIINEGEIVVVEHISTLKEQAVRRIDLYFESAINANSFAGVAGLTEIVVDGEVAQCTVTGSERELLRAAVNHDVMTVHTHEPSLDEIFLTLVKSSHPQ